MIIPFLNFSGKCSHAIALYESVFTTSDKRVMYFKDLPPMADAPIDPAHADYVLHAEMTINDTTVWLGDTLEEITSGDMVSLSLTFKTPEDVNVIYEKLLDGGTSLSPPAATFYSPMFATVKDKFGVIWHLICQ